MACTASQGSRPLLPHALQLLKSFGDDIHISLLVSSPCLSAAGPHTAIEPTTSLPQSAANSVPAGEVTNTLWLGPLRGSARSSRNKGKLGLHLITSSKILAVLSLCNPSESVVLCLQAKSAELANLCRILDLSSSEQVGTCLFD